MKNHQTNKGYLLVEAMVALAIFSIGMLGLTAAQLSASKNNLSSLIKTETAINTADIVDMMRSNLPGVAAGDYDGDYDVASHISNSIITQANENQADEDIGIWLSSLSEVARGMTPEASITCVGAIGLDCTIEVMWDDSRAASEPEPEVFSFRTRVIF